MFKKLDHVGIIVKNLDEALKLYSDIFGLNSSDMNIVSIKDAGIRIVLLPIGDNSIELIEPSGTKSRFAQHLRERGEGLFHLSIFTEDFDFAKSVLIFFQILI